MKERSSNFTLSIKSRRGLPTYAINVLQAGDSVRGRERERERAKEGGGEKSFDKLLCNQFSILYYFPVFVFCDAMENNCYNK